MKSISFFKMSFFAVALSTSLFFTACDKNDDDDGETYVLSGNATGAQENPAVSTTATATLNGTYNSRTNTLQYNIGWTGLTSLVTVAHFHGPAGVGINANPVIDISVGNTAITSSASGSVVIADSLESALLSGNIYYNIHTVNHPTGEIRGQVISTVN